MKTPKNISVVKSPKCELHGEGAPCTQMRLSKNSKTDTDCSWWVNSEKHNYCFWTYIYDKSNPDGVMDELNQGKIAKLLNCNSSAVIQLIDDAMAELNQIMNSTEAGDLLDGSSPDADSYFGIDYTKFESDT